MGPCLFIYKNVNIIKRHTKSASISFRRDSLRGLFALLRLPYAMACPRYGLPTLWLAHAMACPRYGLPTLWLAHAMACPDVEEARQLAGGTLEVMKRHTKSASISFRRDSLRGLFALLRLAYAMACPDVEEARQQAGGPLEVWWSLGDSNPWPIRCERIALAN